MSKFTKWITGGLAWAMFGPIGGIIGFVVAAMLEGNGTKKYDQQEAQFNQTTREERRTKTGDYVMSLLVLVAAMMKADGKVLKSELDYVKTFFIRSWGRQATKEALIALRDLLNQNIPVADVCKQIQRNTDYYTRLNMVHFLFGVAKSDGKVDSNELKLLEYITNNLGISTADFKSIKSMFINDVNAAYDILGISPEASIEEIKKAYRKMATQYHPDKVSYLGEEFQEEAKSKFQKLNDAYETIKKERNFL